MNTKIFLIVVALFFVLAVRPAHAEGTITVSGNLYKLNNINDYYSMNGITPAVSYTAMRWSTQQEVRDYGCTLTSTNYLSGNGSSYSDGTNPFNCKKAGVYTRYGNVGTVAASVCSTHSAGTFPTCICDTGYTPNAGHTACVLQTSPTCTAGADASYGTNVTVGGGFPDYVCYNHCVYRSGSGIATTDGNWLLSLGNNVGTTCNTADAAASTKTAETSTTTTTTTTTADGTASSSVASTTTVGDRATESTQQAISTTLNQIDIDLSGIARETTVQSILTQETGIHSDTTAIKNSFDLTGQSTTITGASTAVGDMDSNTSTVTGKFTDAQAMPESAWSWFSWTPDFGAGTCAPFSKVVFGHTITLDLCPWVANIRDALGWLFAMFAAWDIFGLTFRRVA